MSHEIRTPLTAILGFSDLILNHNENDVENLKDWGQRIKANGSHLLKVINEILDVSKIESGRMELSYQTVSVQEAVRELHGLLAPLAQKNNNRLSFTLQSPVPAFLEIDPTRLKQILINVIGNALKFSETGSVDVQVSYVSATSQLCFLVEDTGIGLSPEQASRLFQPFSQGDDSHTRRFGGTGLGLSLSRKLARCMGGDVSLVRSTPGEGSTFQICVGAKAPAQTAMLGELSMSTLARPVPHEDPAAISLEGLSVLLAEDSVDNQRLISILLRKSGVTIDIASDGAEAFEMALAKSYDLILMDIQMPKRNGYEVCRELRQRGYNGPITALTAHARPEDEQRAFDSGFNGHLSKPIERSKLLHFVKDYARIDSLIH
jgi:CheY-like chemotaxis protein